MSAVDSAPPSDAGYKRKRSPSPGDGPPTSRRRSYSPPSRAVDVRVEDADPVRRAERERQLAARLAAIELERADKGKEKAKDGEAGEVKEFDAMAEFAKLSGAGRSGGVYMPPARLRALREAASADRSSPEYQRLSWDALRKSITGIVNRVNVANIKHIIPELFAENLIRGRGLFARSVMKAQSSSLPFTPVFAALVAILNTKLPQVGELVLTRLVSQFRRAFKRNDKTVCHSTTTFIAHLVNQSVAHEVLALQILVLLLERPTDDSIEIAVGFAREVGQYLTENSPKANQSIFERFRAVLNEGTISHRVQYMIEVLMQVRKDKYKDHPIVPEGLDLVEEDDQITHEITLEEELKVEEGLNIFKFDPNYLENEEKYKQIKIEILGDSDSDDESGSGSEEDSDEDAEVAPDKQGIEDRTETNLVNLRRTIYLTIMNALNYEEAVHKLLKVQIKEGEEIELVNMLIECCSQERSYSTFYGLISERFCKINRVWNECFEEAFNNYYNTIHRYETNRLRNIARLFGHLLANDAISWAVLQTINITEEATTSSSRIFVKIMFTEVMEAMGLPTVKERFSDPEVRMLTRGMFPLDNPKDTRFSINYFTSIGLGAVTEEMREHLQNAPRLIMEQRRQMLEQESSSSDSDSSDSSSDSSDSDSDSDSSDDRRSRSPPARRRDSPPPRRPRDSPPPRARDVSPPPRRRDSPPPRARDLSPPRRRMSISPPPRRRDSPPPRARDISPPPRRRDSPPHRRRADSPPHRRRADSPPPRRRDESPPPRRRDVSPPPRRASPPPRRGRSESRSISPPPKRGYGDRDVRMRDDRDKYSRRESPPPPRRRRGSESMSRSPPPPPRERGYGRERSPPPARTKDDFGRERDTGFGGRERDNGYERRREGERYGDRRR